MGTCFLEKSVLHKQGWLHRPHTQKATCWVEALIAILKFLAIPEQEASYFHFALGPMNYVISPAHKCPTSG